MMDGIDPGARRSAATVGGQAAEPFARLRAALANTDYRPARSDGARRAIFALRYRAYLAQGLIEPRPDGLLTDDYEDLPNAHLIGVHVEGLLSASIRLHVVTSGSDDRSPALDRFPNVLGPMLREGLGLVDPDCFFVDRTLAVRWPDLAYLVLRAPFIAADWFGMDIVAATIRREHAAFYYRVLRMTPRAAPRAYPDRLTPLGLMTVDYVEEAPNVLRRHPFFAARPNEARRMFA